MSSLFDLAGETALIIGGTGVLGGAISGALSDAGARVVIAGRDRGRGEERAAALRSGGSEAIFLQLDATSSESLQDARQEILRLWSGVTILVNAAGGNRPQATMAPGTEFSDLKLEAWQEVLNLNLIGGVLLPCQVFGQAMLEAGRGSIINIASMAGMTPLSRVPAYSAAKAAVLNLTQFLAREWARRGVRVNAISPGFFPAEQNRSLLMDSEGKLTARGDQIISHTPMGRFGAAEELAGAATWLASSRASSFVTGQNIVIDGGFSAMTI